MHSLSIYLAGCLCEFPFFLPPFHLSQLKINQLTCTCNRTLHALHSDCNSDVILHVGLLHKPCRVFNTAFYFPYSLLGSNYYVRILSTIDRELLKPSASVALHKHSNALVDVLPPEADSSIAMLTAEEKPSVLYSDIGGMDIQKQEMREAVELPLTHFELYKQIGIDPPRGVLMFGPPGCGKTMLAKAVAHHTTASFIRVVGSEFVQKYLGEGPRMVRDVFRLAKENAPAIIFIDEIDAIATKRFDAQTGGMFVYLQDKSFRT